MARISIIGAGAWGTALACIARRGGHETILWARAPEVAQSINNGQGNPLYLPDVPLEAGIEASSELASAVENSDAVMLVVPSQFLRQVVEAAAPHLPGDAPIVICAKGIETTSGALMTEMVEAALPSAEIAVLSGPTFAREVAAGLPTAATLACQDAEIGSGLIEMIGDKRFRPYLSDDIVGAEIGGAVKNVLAIACGIVTGKKFGDNARAALITRGLSEMVRFGLAKGAKLETMMGLSGLGDLTLTCNGPQSRNMSLGMALGEGRDLESILGERRSVAEGVETARAITMVARRLGVEMPICEAVNSILHEGEEIDNVIAELLRRPFRPESVMADRLTND